MGKFILSRLLLLVPVIFFISLAVFLMLHFAPGDPVTLATGQSHITPEQEREVRQAMGLSDPLYVQYARWLGRALTGDLGRSFFGSRSVSAVFANRLPATLELALIAMVIAAVTGVSSGILSAYKKNTLFDHASMLLSLVGIAMPSFWLGLVVIYVFGVQLRWMSVSGRLSVGTDLHVITNFYILDSLLKGNLNALVDALKHLILPASVLGLVQTAFIARMTRAMMLEVLGQEYVRTARAKGLSERVVLVRHAFRNAAIPVVTVIGLQIGFLLGGTIIVETVFAWPGVGKLLVDSVLSRDYPMVQGVTLASGVIFAFVNLATDILYRMLDPQVRY